jgi:uncharacterized protein (DUF2249 family)
MSSTVMIASDAADVAAAGALATCHAELLGGLELRVRAVLAAADRPGPALTTARDALVAWCLTELDAHTAAEERLLFPAARELVGLEPLVRVMAQENGSRREVLARLEREEDPIRLAADAGALRAAVTAHLAKADELLAPALAADRTTSLAGLVDELAAAVPPATVDDAGRRTAPSTDGPASVEQDSHPGPAGGHRGCACHDEPPADHPELDARAIPHAIRHATVFGALGAIGPRQAMVLVAPHDPLPLLRQIDQRFGPRFEVRYLERGPDAWRLLFARGDA